MATFDGVRSRFWGYVGGQLQVYGGIDSPFRIPLLNQTAEDKWTQYATRWAYYANRRLYYILKSAGVREVAMPTEWNPVPAVVAFYVANVLGGELRVVVDDNLPTGEALATAIEQIWDWSNFTALKREATETAAVLGDVFVKVAERQDGDEMESDGETTAVYLQNIPPETVRWWSVDERGFLTGIRIDTPRTTSIFTGKAHRHTLVELWRKEWPPAKEGEPMEPGGVRWYESPAGRAVEDDKLPEPVRSQTFAELGYDFIPLVWAEVNTYWWQLTDQIDRHNALGLKLDRLNRPTGVIHGRHTDSAGRPMPAPRIDITEVETTYQEAADGTFGWIKVPGNSQFDWASSPVDFATVMTQMESVRRGVESALPEYRVATLDATQVATETLQMLLSQAGQRALEMRAVLERALIRAQMMAVSIAQVAGLPEFDAATIGSWEAGTTEHVFDSRDVFETPITIKAAILKELVAAGMPVKLAMAQAGFDQGAVDEYDAAAAEEALRQRTTLAAQLVRQQALMDSGAADNGALDAMTPTDGLTQNDVLNGAQIKSSIDIIDAFNRGMFPRANALVMMETFFNLPRAVAESIVPVAPQGSLAPEVA